MAESPLTHPRPLIMVVDDEDRVREVMRSYLERADFRVVEAGSGTGALSLLQLHSPDLIVLDVMLPELDGFSLLERLRDRDHPANPLAARPDTPIILLTARTGESDRISGLQIGADDYVVKPFSPREMVERVKVVLRRATRTTAPPAPIITFDAWQIDPAMRALTRDGESIALTRLDFDLLLFLASHPGQVFTHEQILTAVWPHDARVDRAVVTSHMYRLREKIERDPDNPRHLQTVWGVGYRFQQD